MRNIAHLKQWYPPTSRQYNQKKQKRPPMFTHVLGMGGHMSMIFRPGLTHCSSRLHPNQCRMKRRMDVRVYQFNQGVITLFPMGKTCHIHMYIYIYYLTDKYHIYIYMYIHWFDREILRTCVPSVCPRGRFYGVQKKKPLPWPPPPSRPGSSCRLAGRAAGLGVEIRLWLKQTEFQNGLPWSC